MAERQQKSSMGSFSRGAELWMHQARLFVVAVWSAILISILVGLGVGGGYFYKKSSPVERYALERNLIAELRLMLFMTNAKMELYVEGERRMLAVSDVSALSQDDADEALRHVHNGAVIGSLTAVGFIFLVTLFWWSYGKRKMQDQRLRGAQLVEGAQLGTMMQARDDTSPYVLAGVPLRKGAENLHTLIAGAQGTGKSQQFFRLMRQVRERGKRAFVYDPTGEFAAAFYRAGKDVILNPLDARSPNWNIWREIERDYHFDNMANGLIPDPAEADPFWAQAGRMVLKDVYRVLGRENRRTNADLYTSIAKSNLDSLHALLLGTAGATYVDPTTERTGMSLKMTVQNQLESFRFLHDQGEAFSLREWVRQEDSDSWVFITARESQRDAMKPVLSLWITTIIMAILDLKPVHRERIWGFLDELPTLQKLDILKLALTNTRKYGLCLVLGVQDFSQLFETYGQYLASTIVNGCQTKLLLRVTDGVAAKKLAELLGQAEMDEKEETVSYGLSSQRDGVSVFARRNLREIVLTSQILTLPDMTGYLTVPGDYPVAHVTYGYEPTPQIAEGFIEREGFGIDFKLKLGGSPGGAPAQGGSPSGGGGRPSPGGPAAPGSPSLFDDDEPRKPITLNDFDPDGAGTAATRSGERVNLATGEISPAKVGGAAVAAAGQPGPAGSQPAPANPAASSTDGRVAAGIARPPCTLGGTDRPVGSPQSPSVPVAFALPSQAGISGGRAPLGDAAQGRLLEPEAAAAGAGAPPPDNAADDAAPPPGAGGPRGGGLANALKMKR